MYVASCVDIWSGFVNGSVNDESCCINGFVCAADALALFVHMYHVRYCQESEMDTVRINPECARQNRVYVNGSIIVALSLLAEKRYGCAQEAYLED
jgi:hypothetical protein